MQLWRLEGILPTEIGDEELVKKAEDYLKTLRSNSKHCWKFHKWEKLLTLNNFVANIELSGMKCKKCGDTTWKLGNCWK